MITGELRRLPVASKRPSGVQFPFLTPEIVKRGLGKNPLVAAFVVPPPVSLCLSLCLSLSVSLSLSLSLCLSLSLSLSLSVSLSMCLSLSVPPESSNR